MSWQDAYRRGSFRGVEFRTSDSELAGGRRVAQHEFPLRDTPYNEDLGRRAGRFAIECWVAGADYFTARDRLIAALNGSGSGVLVHPYHGTLSVVCTDWTCRESTEEGGIARFSIEFREAGDRAPAPAKDTANLAKSAAKDARVAAPVQFADRFSVQGATAFVEENAAKVIDGAAAAIAIAGGLHGGFGPALAAFQARVGILPANLEQMLRAPLALGAAIVGAVQAVSALARTPQTAIGALIGLLQFGADLPPVIGATPARDRERSNQDAVSDLVALAAAAELADVIAGTDFGSYQDAVAVRDQITERIDDRVVVAADRDDDEMADAFARLGDVIIADVTARGGSLSRVYAYTPAQCEPSLVIAHRLYGAVGTVAGADEIVRRNAIARPMFVPVAPIEVLEAADG
ncbi:MAG: DNA circularization protein [Pseudomonadota bacterium]